MIRVGFLPLYNIEYPSSRYRVFQFFDPLQRAGFQTAFIPAPQRNNLHRITYLPKLLFMAHHCKVIFIQKRTFPLWILRIIHRVNQRIIFDFDDAIYLNQDKKSTLIGILSLASLVIAGNKQLEIYAAQYNSKVRIIPSVVNTEVYLPPAGVRHPNDDRVVLGWIGTKANRGDLSQVNEVLDRLAEIYQNKVVLRVISNDLLQIPTSLTIENIPWSLNNYQHFLQQFDIGIMPMQNNEWNRGKCGFKLIQYLAVGSAAVASSVGVNSQIIKSGETGYLADNPSEWTNSLISLIENPKIREKLGHQGRVLIEQSYSVKSVMPAWIDALVTVASK
jgi:glycosyltransferase involved in cell wall biosynthesis